MQDPPALACPPLTADGYGRWFTDAAVWAPYVKWVARRHGLGAARAVPGDVPGSHPVFLTGAGTVVKFYAPHWPEAFEVEAAVYDALVGAGGRLAGVSVPRVVARGTLFTGPAPWPWPYLVTDVLPGRSVGALAGRVGPADRLALARALAPAARALHALPHGGPAGVLARHSRVCWDEWRGSAVARLRAEGVWPEALLAGVGEYLREALAASAGVAPRLVHGDLTQDHALLTPAPPGWALSGLIDFADALVADPAYELVAMHLDLFRCDRGLLAAFVEAYGGAAALGPDWRRRATACVLLFPFDTGQTLSSHIADWALLRDPRDLEEALWPGRP